MSKEKDTSPSSSSSSDDEPLEIVDFSRVGLFEGAVHELTQLLLGRGNNNTDDNNNISINEHETITTTTFTIELPEPLQGIHDFRQGHALHGNNASPSPQRRSTAGDTNNNMTIFATLVLRSAPEEGEENNNDKESLLDSSIRRRQSMTMTNNKNKNSAIEGLLGLPSYLYLRPKQRVLNLSPQLTSTLLSIGLSALDQVNSRNNCTSSNNNNKDNNLINIPVVAPCGNRFSMSYKASSSFFYSSSAEHEPTHAEFVLASPNWDHQLFPQENEENHDDIANCCDLVLIVHQNNNNNNNNNNSLDNNNQKSRRRERGVNIVTEAYSNQVNLSETDSRSMSGLSTLDGLVDFFVNSTITGKRKRFRNVSIEEIGKTTNTNSTTDENSERNSSSSNISGTIWADASRIYRTPVPHKKRWSDSVLALWNPKANGHSRAVAGLFLGFDDPSWNKHLAGCPSLPLGSTENPIESFSIELGWEFLSVEATSITDNESSSWFDDIVQGLFVSSLNASSSEDASSSAMMRGGKSSTNSIMRKNPAAAAAIASLGPPTSVQIASHLRYRGEFSSRVSHSFTTFVRNSGQVLAVQLDDARRRYLVQQSTDRLARKGGRIVDTVTNAISPVTRMNDEHYFGDAASHDQTKNNNQDDESSNSKKQDLRSAVSSWVSALWSTGTSAVNAVAHSASDAIKRSHPEELIISRKSLLAVHCNNVLAALRRPDNGTDSFIVAKPVNGMYTNGLRPSDLRRQIPPGSIISRFAVECSTLKHADMVAPFFSMLIDVLKEVLTGTRGKEEMPEEYSTINALQLLEESSGSSDDHGTNNSNDELKSLRADILISCLLVDFEEDGVDCVADIFHQKMQALAICARGIKDSLNEEKNSTNNNKLVEIESPRRLVTIHQEANNEEDNSNDEPIYAPPVRKFVPPITYGDSREEEEAEESESESDNDNKQQQQSPAPHQQSNQGFASRILLRDMSDFLQANSKRKKDVCLADFLAWFSPSDVLRKKKVLTGSLNDTDEVTTKLVLGDDEDIEDEDKLILSRKSSALDDTLKEEDVDAKNKNSSSSSSEFQFSEEFIKEAEREEEHAKNIGSLPLGYLYLSSRMKSRGNAWREAWHIVSKTHSAMKLSQQASSSLSSTKNNNNNKDDDDPSTTSVSVMNPYGKQSASSSSSSSSGTNNNNNVSQQQHHPEDEPLEEALEILKWFKARPEREIMYVVMKGQVAASAAQLVQHPIYEILEKKSVMTTSATSKKDQNSSAASSSDNDSDEKKEKKCSQNKNHRRQNLLLSKVTSATMSRISQCFPSWSDYDDVLQVYVEDHQKENKNENGNDKKQNNNNNNNNHEPMDSLVPEIQHNLVKLFSIVTRELERAEYLLCCAIGVCDAVSPFGSSDTSDLLKFTNDLVVSVFRHIGSSSFASGNNNNSSSIRQEETKDLPVPWSNTILAGDSTERVSEPVFIDPNLFFFGGSRSSSSSTGNNNNSSSSGPPSHSLCVAWLDADRGSVSEYENKIVKAGVRHNRHLSNKTTAAPKIRKEVMRRYRIYGYTEQIELTDSNNNNFDDVDEEPALFQRLNVVVEKSTKKVTLANFASRIL